MHVHVQLHVLVEGAWSSAGAQAGACARAGVFVRLLQHTFRCLSANIIVGTAYFSPTWSYKLRFFYFKFSFLFDLPLIGILV